MNMTFEAYDNLTVKLEKIENIDAKWLPDPKDLDERLNEKNEMDVYFLIWLSLTVSDALEAEAITKRQALMRKLYEYIELTD